MLPYQDRLRTALPKVREVHKGLGGLFHRLKGYQVRAGLKPQTLLQRASAIATGSLEYADWSEADFLTAFKQAQFTFLQDPKDNDATDLVLSLLAEGAARALGMRPYPVQIMGALILHKAALAEMATGEGKSLTTAIGACLMACYGKPVHVLSSNDYLAERDEEEMRPLFAFMGVSSTSIVAETPKPERKAHHACAIVYTTGKELLGDFLADRLVIGPNGGDVSRALERLLLGQEGDAVMLRGLHTVLVDEADSVLIDEAVTPLILSVPRDNITLQEATLAAYEVSQFFEAEQDYRIDQRYRDISLTQQGRQKLAEKTPLLPRMWQGQERREELLLFALQARELFLRDEHYVIQDDKIVLLDILTGRLTPDRNLGIGLQQALEAKEGLEINPPTETLARFSYQKFFRLIPHLAGMSGTLEEAHHELWQIYHLPIVSVPTHRPIQRRNLGLRWFQRAAQRDEALLSEARALHAQGHAVLIGTRTVEQSERLAQALKDQQVSCRVLNAVHHLSEAEIVKQAGQSAALTIATNMAGRGTDIKLSAAVKDSGGLFVLSMEPQDSARIDRQLYGRAGRQGDPGAYRAYASLEDRLVVNFSKKIGRWMVAQIARFVPSVMVGYITWLQGRSERHAMHKRVAILESDAWYEDYLSFPGVSPSKSAKD